MNFQDWEEAYYLHNQFLDESQADDIFSQEYYILESKLASSYSDEQMNMYVELESMKEGAIADLKEQYYKKGYTDAIQLITDQKNNEEDHQ